MDFKQIDRRSFVRIGLTLGLSPSLLFSMQKDEEFLTDFLKRKKDPIKLLDVSWISQSELRKIESKIYQHHNIVSKNTKKEIALNNIHTGEKEIITYKTGLVYNTEELKKFNYFMRDFRENKTIKIDPKILDFLYTIQNKLNKKDEIFVLSGYRTKKTNDMLRRQGHHAAKNSFHIKGKAIDISIPTVSTEHLSSVARSLFLGGVGEYKDSYFTHIDVGPIRHWKG